MSDYVCAKRHPDGSLTYFTWREPTKPDDVRIIGGMPRGNIGDPLCACNGECCPDGCGKDVCCCAPGFTHCVVDEAKVAAKAKADADEKLIQAEMRALAIERLKARGEI